MTGISVPMFCSHFGSRFKFGEVRWIKRRQTKPLLTHPCGQTSVALSHGLRVSSLVPRGSSGRFYLRTPYLRTWPRCSRAAGGRWRSLRTYPSLSSRVPATIGQVTIMRSSTRWILIRSLPTTVLPMSPRFLANLLVALTEGEEGRETADRFFQLMTAQWGTGDKQKKKDHEKKDQDDDDCDYDPEYEPK